MDSLPEALSFAAFRLLKKAKTLFLLFSGCRVNVFSRVYKSLFHISVRLIVISVLIFISAYSFLPTNFEKVVYKLHILYVYIFLKKVLNRTKCSSRVNVAPVARVVSFRFLAWGPFR